MSHSKIDPTLVTPWSECLGREEPYEYPFKVSYSRSNKKLIYIASLHANTFDSPTFKMIESTFHQHKIEFVILEGFGFSLGVSPKDRINWANQQWADGAYEGFETAFSIVQANAKRIPFVGGEPDDSYIHSQTLHAGYGTDDLIFYQFLQQVFQYRELHPAFQIDSERLFKSFIRTKSPALGLQTAPAFTDFKMWYLNKMGSAFDPTKIEPEDLAPHSDGNRFTQRISSVICKIRDQFVVTIIDEALNENNSLLVIYGGSHWSMQKKALESYFGTPTFEK